MENSISKNWYLLLIKGIIMILLAVLIFTSPAGALLAWVFYIGIGFIIAGVVRIIQGVQAKGILDKWGWILLEGILDIILGIILIAHPGLTLSILPFIIGFWAAMYGFFLIIDGFSGTGNSVIKIIGGILIVILGFVIIFNPIMMGLTLTIWIGIMLLIAGIFTAIASFSLK